MEYSKKKIKTLHVNAADLGGGAERFSFTLVAELNQQGYSSWLAVGKQSSDAKFVIKIPNEKPVSLWEKTFFLAGSLTKTSAFFFKRHAHIKGIWRIEEGLKKTAQFCASFGRYENYKADLQGREQFYYPASKKLLDLVPEKPDLLHFHNLHGNYFDLRELANLSNILPTIITLHDSWLLSGHCAQSFLCDRWKAGCGKCPDLSIYPAIKKDATALNWKIKKDVYKKSKLYIATTCEWMKNKIKDSILGEFAVQTTMIRNGIDTVLFSPGSKKDARVKTGLPEDVFIGFCVANSVKSNVFKDYKTLKKAARYFSSILPEEKLIILCLGETGTAEFFGNVEIRFIKHCYNRETLVDYYRAADVFLYIINADTFPTSTLEALACGTPVIATGLAGLPEQIVSLDDLRYLSLPLDDEYSVAPTFASKLEATGVLVRLQDYKAVAHTLEYFVNNKEVVNYLSENAAKYARIHFGQEKQITEYVAWYQNVIAHFHEYKISK